MCNQNDTTTVKTVKISAPFPLKAHQRLIIVDDVAVNVATSSDRQQGDHLYCAIVTLLHEKAALYTTAPEWANVEIV